MFEVNVLMVNQGLLLDGIGRGSSGHCFLLGWYLKNGCPLKGGFLQLLNKRITYWVNGLHMAIEILGVI